MARASKKDEKNIQIGIDIGSHSVKAVAMLHAEPKRQLLNFSVKEVKDDCVGAIKEAFAELGVPLPKIISSISGASVVVRYIELPTMTEEELKGATRFEAEKVIPYNIDDVILDSGKIEDLSDNRMRVVLVAAKKDLVNSKVQMLRAAELEPVALDIDSFAMMRAFAYTGIDRNSVCGLLNIGAKVSNLNIVKGDISYLCRDIELGGNDINKIISGRPSILETGDEETGPEEDRLSKFEETPPDEKKKIEDALEGVLLRLADEVRLSFDFYENRYADNVAKVYISGGVSRINVVAGLLKENLGCDALGWDLFSSFDLNGDLDHQLLDEVKPQLTVAHGLSLRSLNL